MNFSVVSLHTYINVDDKLRLGHHGRDPTIQPIVEAALAILGPLHPVSVLLPVLVHHLLVLVQLDPC